MRFLYLVAIAAASYTQESLQELARDIRKNHPKKIHKYLKNPVIGAWGTRDNIKALAAFIDKKDQKRDLLEGSEEIQKVSEEAQKLLSKEVNEKEAIIPLQVDYDEEPFGLDAYLVDSYLGRYTVNDLPAEERESKYYKDLMGVLSRSGLDSLKGGLIYLIRDRVDEMVYLDEVGSFPGICSFYKKDNKVQRAVDGKAFLCITSSDDIYVCQEYQGLPIMYSRIS